jgi:L-aspartate oxidase
MAHAKHSDDARIVVIGGGLAGLFAALKLAPLPVTIVSDRALGHESSSAWAQGGIAAAITGDDTPLAHVADTVKAGAGLVNEPLALLVAQEAGERIEDLLSFGVPFDRDAQGRLTASREAAHGARRVLHVQGDQAGAAIMSAVARAARECATIRILEGLAARELIVEDRRVLGVRLRDDAGRDAGALAARAVVLATGGIGALYAVTTNPIGSYGEGMALAAQAGAVISDAEFVQFHPTALNVGRDPAPLATEALRGDGALLINGRGERFMLALHPDVELAPRDIVARAVHRELASGRGAFLDCRQAPGARIQTDFPGIYMACCAAGIDPVTQPMPIAPAAHYHMGGVLTDGNGRTSLDQLWACGEVACTGLHGANRLASNSLLEAVVMAARIARDIAQYAPGWHGLPPPLTQLGAAAGRAVAVRPYPAQAVTTLRQAMSQYAGVERSRDGLIELLGVLTSLEKAHPGAERLQAMITSARLIAIAALAREESRGSHQRLDFSETSDGWRRHSYLGLAEANAAAAEHVRIAQRQQPARIAG